MNRIIPLGTVVRDKVTGFVGVAENRATFRYGCDRYCVQPKMDAEGKVAESKMIDEPQLEIVEGEAQVMQEPAPPPKLVKLGQLVYDPIYDIEGTVAGRAVYLNGCSRVWIVQKKFKDGKIDDGYWTDEKAVIGRKKMLGDAKMAAPAETLEFHYSSYFREARLPEISI